MRDGFAVFILSHGRADRLITLDTLNRTGYTGKWYIILDNEDDTIDDYIARCGKEHIIVFDKAESAKSIDSFDLSDNRQTIVYARNECFKIAKDLGLTHFLELDDDYTNFEFRYAQEPKLMTKTVDNIDDVFESFLTFLDETPTATIALAQGGDLLGGLKKGSYFEVGLLRKAMNSFFCRTDRPFKFVGRINEDVNTYTTLGMRGGLFFTFTKVDLTQVTTQHGKGGMSDVYNSMGTYVKSFYTVMTCPSSVKITEMGAGHARIHHRIDWEHTVPKIISSDFKKK